jgi:hypothetical protein
MGRGARLPAAAAVAAPAALRDLAERRRGPYRPEISTSDPWRSHRIRTAPTLQQAWDELRNLGDLAHPINRSAVDEFCDRLLRERYNATVDGMIRRLRVEAKAVDCETPLLVSSSMFGPGVVHARASSEDDRTLCGQEIRNGWRTSLPRGSFQREAEFGHACADCAAQAKGIAAVHERDDWAPVTEQEVAQVRDALRRLLADLARGEESVDRVRVADAFIETFRDRLLEEALADADRFAQQVLKPEERGRPLARFGRIPTPQRKDIYLTQRKLLSRGLTFLDPSDRAASKVLARQLETRYQ